MAVIESAFLFQADRKMAHAVQSISNGAEVSRRGVALAMNINAGKGLQEVLRSNLGPRGTLKMCALRTGFACASNLH